MERCIALNKLQMARTAHLDAVANSLHVLMLGEGPGRLLEELIQRLPAADFFVVEQSEQMIFQAQQVIRSSNFDLGRITWMHGDALDLKFGSRKYDLVTTPFFLDCFTQTQLAALIPGLACVCNPDAYWLLTDFQIPKKDGWHRLRAKWIHWLMYRFFHRVTSISATSWIDPDEFMKTAGLELQARKELNFGLIRSDLWKRSI